jgi:HK97 family phage major capsid protein/HK97 family phage prohead protease
MTIIRKATSSEVGPDLTFVLSDATVDRMGDTIDPAGWDLRWFRKNPIALFGHDSGFPIGNWADVRVDAGKLKGRLVLASEGTSGRIDEIRRLVEQGILRAVSVGFKPIEAEPIDRGSPYGGQRYKKSELLETSLVSVPANPAALAVAKSLHISDDTLRMAFGEQAERGLGGRGTTGEHAEPPKLPIRKSTAMSKTISERVVDAQAAYLAAKDAYVEYGAADDFEPANLDSLEATMKEAEDKLGGLKRLEANVIAKGGDLRPAAPAIQPNGRQKDIGGIDLLVRAAVARGVSHFGGKPLDQVLDERYKGHQATAFVAKADQTIGTTTVTGWAAELVQTVNAGFLDALMPDSFYAKLSARGIRLSFDGYGTVSIPSRTAGGAAGGFVAEGAPIRVGRVTTAATTMTAKKMGVIIPFSRELAKRSTPAIEALVRQAIVEDTAVTLDTLMIDAVASSTARPAGLLNGVSATASGVGGGDYESVKSDFKALLAPFIAANAAGEIVVLMNPSQGLNLALMDGPDGNTDWFGPIRQRVTIIESGNVPANRLIAIRASDLATAMGDSPDFDISEQATVHMEDTTPLEIVSGTGPTTADPVRSFFQTATIGVRMLMDVSWAMRRSGMVRWIDTTSW